MVETTHPQEIQKMTFQNYVKEKISAKIKWSKMKREKIDVRYNKRIEEILLK